MIPVINQSVEFWSHRSFSASSSIQVGTYRPKLPYALAETEHRAWAQSVLWAKHCWWSRSGSVSCSSTLARSRIKSRKAL